MISNRLRITLMLIVGFLSPALRADTFKCVRFLENYLIEIEAERHLIPLQDGETPPILGTERLLADVAAVRTYLAKNPESPWSGELNAFAANPTPNTVVYLSEVGPTVWDLSELNVWIKMVRKGTAAKAGQARAFLHNVGYDHIKFPLISERAHRYVRTANYVSQVRALNQLDAFMLNVLSDLDPTESAKARELLDIPYRQRRLMRYVFGRTDGYRELRTRERARELAHLGIDYEIRKIRARPLEPALRVESSAGALWAARTLLREPLIRRKLSVEWGQLKTLGQRLTPDQVLWLSIFPELAPHWRLVRLIKAKLKYVNISRPTSNEYSRLLSVPVNDSGDTLNLNLHRREWMEDSSDEPLGASLTLDAPNTADGIKRVRRWAAGDWLRIDAFADLVHRARITQKKSQLRITNLTPAQALALFAHLQNFYGESWQ